MRFIHSNFIIIGIIFLFSCQEQEIDTNLTSNADNTDAYYDLLEESLNSIFNETYKNITINTSFSEMANMFNENCKDFFINKGITITSYNIEHTRGTYASPFDNFDNLDESSKTIVNKVHSILQLPTYENVRINISQLYSQALANPIHGKKEILRYLKYIENMLIFLDTEKGKFNVLNAIVRYNEFHEIKVKTRTSTEQLPDGIYPHPLEENRYIVIIGGAAHEFECPKGLVYRASVEKCIEPDGQDGKEGWWDSWGRCAAAILGGVGTGGLGGAGVGSAIPGLGTVAGAIAGAISGAFTGAAAGC